MPSDLKSGMSSYIYFDNKFNSSNYKLSNAFFLLVGSSVATSLTEGESIKKRIGLLKIYKTHFTMCPIELKTVRPFIYKELVLKTVDEMNNMNDGSLTLVEFTLDLVRKKVDEMITAAKSLGNVIILFNS